MSSSAIISYTHGISLIVSTSLFLYTHLLILKNKNTVNFFILPHVYTNTMVDDGRYKKVPPAYQTITSQMGANIGTIRCEPQSDLKLSGIGSSLYGYLAQQYRYAMTNMVKGCTSTYRKREYAHSHQWYLTL